VTLWSIEQKTIIISYVKLRPRADRFSGGPEVEIEIGDKRAVTKPQPLVLNY